MSVIETLLTDLKIRLGYNESITLTRDEFNLIVDGDVYAQEELQEEIEKLESELEDAIDSANVFQEESEELKEKVESLKEEIKELKKVTTNE